MITLLALKKAKQAWNKPATKGINVDHVLVEAFAEIIDETWSEAGLGNATTKELLDEIAARVDLNYKTADDDDGRK